MWNSSNMILMKSMKMIVKRNMWNESNNEIMKIWNEIKWKWNIKWNI